MSSIKIRIKHQDSGTLLRLLITHPMETGRRRLKETGELVPAHFIETVKIERNGVLVANCRLSTGVSRDPYLSLRFRGGKSGDRIKVSWRDNLGLGDAEEALIP